MTEHTPDSILRMVGRTLIFEWRQQVVHKHLTSAGLWALRARLTSGSTELEPGADLDLLLVEVEAALGVKTRNTAAPDDASGLEAPPDSG